MHVSRALFAATIFGLYVFGAQASPYLHNGGAGHAGSRRWSDHPSASSLHRYDPNHLNKRAEGYVYEREVDPLRARAPAHPRKGGDAFYHRNADPPSKRGLSLIAPRWTDSPNRKVLTQRTPMFSGAGAAAAFHYVGGGSSSSSASECSRSSRSSGDYSDTSQGTMRSTQCIEANYVSDGGRSTRLASGELNRSFSRLNLHRSSSEGGPSPGRGGARGRSSSSELERTRSVELDSKLKTKWLWFVGRDNKIYITGLNGILGLFIYVEGSGIQAGHIDPRNGINDIRRTIDAATERFQAVQDSVPPEGPAKAKIPKGSVVKAMVFANNEHDYGTVKNLLRKSFPKLEVKKIVYKWHKEPGFWEFVARFSQAEGIKVTKRWIPERAWNPNVELEGVRIE